MLVFLRLAEEILLFEPRLEDQIRAEDEQQHGTLPPLAEAAFAKHIVPMLFRDIIPEGDIVPVRFRVIVPMLWRDSRRGASRHTCTRFAYDLQCKSSKSSRRSATATSQPAPSPTTGNTTTFDASIMLVGVDDNGSPSYKLKGAQYMKFDVRVWPETLPALGIDPVVLKPGPNPGNLGARALMGEKGPRKVISLA